MTYSSGSLAHQLEVALLTKDLTRAKKLLEGRGINEPLEGRDCAIHVACSVHNLEFVRYLVEECGADVNAKADHDYTPIDVVWWHSEGPMGVTNEDKALPVAAYLSGKGGLPNAIKR